MHINYFFHLNSIQTKAKSYSILDGFHMNKVIMCTDSFLILYLKEVGELYLYSSL